MAVFDLDEQNSWSRIAACAYQIWQQEGCPEGQAAEHWAMAEDLIHRQETSSRSETGFWQRAEQELELVPRRRPRRPRPKTLLVSAV